MLPCFIVFISSIPMAMANPHPRFELLLGQLARVMLGCLYVVVVPVRDECVPVGWFSICAFVPALVVSPWVASPTATT